MTITWTVTQLETTTIDNLNNVATQVCFTVFGEEIVTTGDISQSFQGIEQGDVRLLPPDPNNFIPIDQATDVQVVQWVKEALGDRVAEIESRVVEQIARAKQPKAAIFIPSWVQ